MPHDDYRSKSYWMTTREYEPGAALQGSIDVDVAIVDGGFTGLSAAHHVNGRTVADLVLGRKTPLTDVFFVNRRTIPWPPEPVRTIAAHAIRGYMRWEDRRFDPKPETHE